ncbi:putative vacuolar ATP synthase subunit c [Leptomonas pyrrhocoris]|uniref:V-type proton ATPase subunit C n=1 Tax=Leptomonas pyrrhocoris TaxID=157538 RepID=A0A0N0VEJ4_LEPPY|nr:putative vacuolar ATP synthase subunit c [Leptomonas pyrrhocoris]KPA78528.1 putative vacuolar ATP synthase subunit c [Leptomonas pyrrhocoris]|eukprot:XP_015656967.1 putative vacuolar ATP synthase subunit c [Leptomonas pyrrhocoris]
MTESFIILALPYLQQSQDSLQSAQYESLVRQMGPLGQTFRNFVIPNLKVGTLDSLMEASDELTKLDPMMENTVQKLIGLMEETSGKPRSIVTTFRINQTQEMSPAGYIKNFLWSSAQFDPKDTIQNLIEKFAQINATADERVRVMLGEYNDTRNKVTAANRKGEGNLSIRPIRELVTIYNRDHQCFVDTDLLVTLFVAVSVASQKEWLESYWKMNEYVCPQSNRVVAEDKEYVLNSIVVFRKVMDDVKAICRKKRYVIREVEGADDLSSAELKELQLKAEKEKKALYTLLWQQYCTCYVAWIHLKAVRVFVESLLKFGLPPRYIAVVLQVPAEKEAEIRKRIAQVYPDLTTPLANDTVIESGALQQEYPYVSLKVANVQK